jgi:hypothetical protein
MPVISEITAAEASEIGGLDELVSYWTEGSYDKAGKWFAEVSASWGPAGLTMLRGEEVLGFAVYGPQEYLPRAGRYPVGPFSEDAALLAYLSGDARTRRHLLVRVVRNLRLRGFGKVEAVTSDTTRPWHVPTRFLLESGWKPVRRALHAGHPYTLMRADFVSLAEIGEFARAFVGRVRLPSFETPEPSALAMALAASALAPACTMSGRKNGGLEARRDLRAYGPRRTLLPARRGSGSR